MKQKLPDLVLFGRIPMTITATDAAILREAVDSVFEDAEGTPHPNQKAIRNASSGLLHDIVKTGKGAYSENINIYPEHAKAELARRERAAKGKDQASENPNADIESYCKKLKGLPTETLRDIYTRSHRVSDLRGVPRHDLITDILHDRFGERRVEKYFASAGRDAAQHPVGSKVLYANRPHKVVEYDSSAGKYTLETIDGRYIVKANSTDVKSLPAAKDARIGQTLKGVSLTPGEKEVIIKALHYYGNGETDIGNLDRKYVARCLIKAQKDFVRSGFLPKDVMSNLAAALKAVGKDSTTARSTEEAILHDWVQLVRDKLSGLIDNGSISTATNEADLYRYARNAVPGAPEEDVRKVIQEVLTSWGPVFDSAFDKALLDEAIDRMGAGAVDAGPDPARAAKIHQKIKEVDQQIALHSKPGLHKATKAEMEELLDKRDRLEERLVLAEQGTPGIYSRGPASDYSNPAEEGIRAAKRDDAVNRWLSRNRGKVNYGEAVRGLMSEFHLDRDEVEHYYGKQIQETIRPVRHRSEPW
ncbi:MAG: hypothetical protein ACYDBV_15325 [Nitrospiria bacterium]